MQWISFECYCSSGEDLRPKQRAQKSCFTRTVGAGNAEDFPGFDLKRNLVNGRVRAKSHGCLIDNQRKIVHCSTY